MLIDTIKKNEKKVIERNWEKLYYLIDVHETLIIPNYKAGEIPKEFYTMAKETMQLLSKRKELCLILYTCSYPSEIKQYLEFFEENGIHFSYVNENPEVLNSGYGCFDSKPYMNLLIDDKAGFDPYKDWQILYDYYLNKI